MYEKIILFIFICLLLFSCQSTAVLPNHGTGTEHHRELENELRTGETELAITSTKIESTSERIEETGKQLEQSIADATVQEQGITDILQSIRNRRITEDELDAVRNK